MTSRAKWDIKKLLTSKRQLNLHMVNFHLGDVKKILYHRNHLIFNKLETVATTN